MKLAQICGFDGLEILINEWFKDRIDHYQSLAQKLALELHFHQAWSADEDPTDKTFWFLEKIGYLPSQGYSIREHVSGLPYHVPIVLQADRMLGESMLGLGPTRYRWQTDCVFDHNKNKPRLEFSEFIRKVKDYNLSVVFDTLHYLEYRLGIFRDYDALPADQYELMDLLIEGWELLGPYVREIHLADFRPGERSVMLGDGIMPLKGFYHMVSTSGWQGSVVPEVSPKALFPYTRAKVKELITRTQVIMSQ